MTRFPASRSRVLLAMLALSAGAPALARVAPPEAAPADSAPAEPDPAILEQLNAEAEALAPFAESNLAQAFIKQVFVLPAPTARTIWQNPDTRAVIGPAQRARTHSDDLAGFAPRQLPPAFYYLTGYGTPLAYSRALDFAAKAGLDAASLEDRRVLDFGFGGIGHLRLLAALGAQVVGTEVSPILKAYYDQPSDQGPFPSEDAKGSVRLAFGQWPADRELRESLAGDFDLIMSKNTLKNGYLNPEGPADPSKLVSLGIDQRDFVEHVYASLKPGGVFVIYNISPRQNPAPWTDANPYIPWADGRSPFPRELLEKTGFEVLHFNEDDSSAARHMGKALGWDKPRDEGGAAMDLESDLFALVTVARKPESAGKGANASR